MTSSKDLFDTLLGETLTYLKENHLPSDRIVFDHTALPETIAAPPPVKRVSPPPAPIKKLPPSPPPAPALKKEEPAPTPPPVPQAAIVPQEEPTHLKKVLHELAPNIFTEERVPDDAVAQKKRFAWKEKRLATEVTILSFESHSKGHIFLQNLATAIDARLLPARVALATLLEKENHWATFFESAPLKQLICFPIPFDRFPGLLKFYRENPGTEKQLLSTTPLFLLRPFADYQRDPLLKKELWSTLCTQLSS